MQSRSPVEMAKCSAWRSRPLDYPCARRGLREEMLQLLKHTSHHRLKPSFPGFEIGERSLHLLQRGHEIVQEAPQSIKELQEGIGHRSNGGNRRGGGGIIKGVCTWCRHWCHGVCVRVWGKMLMPWSFISSLGICCLAWRKLMLWLPSHISKVSILDCVRHFPFINSNKTSCPFLALDSF